MIKTITIKGCNKIYQGNNEKEDFVKWTARK
jgi:hypothetical protein